jgi:hypothetical protein
MHLVLGIVIPVAIDKHHILPIDQVGAGIHESC